MPVQFNLTENGIVGTVLARPANTTFNNIFSEAEYSLITISGISLICHSAAAASIYVDDGTNQWYLADAVSLSVNTTTKLDLPDIVVPNGYTIHVKSSVSSAITFIVTLFKGVRPS